MDHPVKETVIFFYLVEKRLVGAEEGPHEVVEADMEGLTVGLHVGVVTVLASLAGEASNRHGVQVWQHLLAHHHHPTQAAPHTSNQHYSYSSPPSSSPRVVGV